MYKKKFFYTNIKSQWQEHKILERILDVWQNISISVKFSEKGILKPFLLYFASMYDFKKYPCNIILKTYNV